MYRNNGRLTTNYDSANDEGNLEIKINRMAHEIELLKMRIAKLINDIEHLERQMKILGDKVMGLDENIENIRASHKQEADDLVDEAAPLLSRIEELQREYEQLADEEEALLAICYDDDYDDDARIDAQNQVNEIRKRAEKLKKSTKNILLKMKSISNVKDSKEVVFKENIRIEVKKMECKKKEVKSLAEEHKGLILKLKNLQERMSSLTGQGQLLVQERDRLSIQSRPAKSNLEELFENKAFQESLKHVEEQIHIIIGFVCQVTPYHPACHIKRVIDLGMAVGRALDKKGSEADSLGEKYLKLAETVIDAAVKSQVTPYANLAYRSTKEKVKFIVNELRRLDGGEANNRAKP